MITRDSRATPGGGPAAADAQPAFVRTHVARRYAAAAASAAGLDDIATAAVAGKDAGRPVEPAVRAPVEAHLGADLSAARVHDDPLAQEASAAMGARAFAHGGDVFLGPGERERDLGLMAHELTHVVQQGAGAARAPQRKVTVGDAASPAEAEADAVAAAVTAGAGPAPALLVDDGPVGPGQLLKSTFLDELRAQVAAAAEAALGPEHTAVGCPYIERYFGRYATRSAADVEGFLRRYAPELRGVPAAAAMIPIVVARVQAGILHWRATGQAPPGLPDDATAAAGPPAPMGPGAPLDGATAARMSDALGLDVGHVRVHTGDAAARLAADQGALAVARGPHVAFAPGQFQPGTPTGDALLAHELAHVAQQDGASGADAAAEGSAALEDDADQVAVGAVARLWAGATSAARTVTGRIGPALRSGLAVQKCGGLSNKPTAAAAEAFINESAALGTYLEGKFKDGTGVTIKYLDEKFFTQYAIQYAMKFTPFPTEAEARADVAGASAFFDRDANAICIRESAATTPAVALHEMMHVYSAPAWKALGIGASEGATEYFTQVVCDENKLKKNEEYAWRVAAVKRLVADTSEVALAGGYFHGRVDALRTATDGKHGAGAFDAWVGYVGADDPPAGTDPFAR